MISTKIDNTIARKHNAEYPHAYSIVYVYHLYNVNFSWPIVVTHAYISGPFY